MGLRRHRVLPGQDSFSFVGCMVENLSCESGRLRCRSVMREIAMRDQRMRDNRTTTSMRQSPRSWHRFRRELAQLLSSLLFVLAVGMLQACGDGSIDAPPGETIAANSAILSWSQPITNQDGSPLTALLGYQVYYGQASPLTTTNSQSTFVVDPDQTSYTLSGLSPDTYFTSW